MAFLVCLLFRESIGVAITKSFVIFVRKFFVSSIYRTSEVQCICMHGARMRTSVDCSLSLVPRPSRVGLGTRLL